MRFRLLALPALATVAALVACSSGGSSSIPASGGSGSSAATGGTPTATASQNIAANDPTATTISTSAGLTITVPPNTFYAATKVTAYQYATASGLPAAAQSQNSRVSAQGRSRALSVMPTGGTFLAGFAIDGGGANPYNAISVTEAFTGTVPAGDVVRVAKLGANGYTDVDTATVSGTNVSNNLNTQYVSVSVGGTAAPYIFYAIASPAAPAAITITVLPQFASQSLAAGGSQAFYATGADANGNYLPFTAAFAVTPSTMGTVVPSLTQPNVATIMANTALGSTTISATDPRTTTVGTFATQVLTQRPGASGDSFTFAGTLKRTDVYTYPVGNVIPPTTQTATIAQTITTTQGSYPFGSATVQDFQTVETDTYPTQTLGSTTNSYYTALPMATLPAPFQFFGSVSIDDAQNETIAVPTSPATIDQLPEVSAATWQNSNAGFQLYEGADGQAEIQTTAANGTYQGEAIVGGFPFITSQTNADFSGEMQVTNFAYTNLIESFNYSAPTNGQITIQQNLYPASTASPSPPPPASTIPPITVAQWFPAGAPPYTDTTVDSGVARIPTGSGFCQVPSTIPTIANELQENTQTIDPVLGTLTTVSTIQYVVPGFGPACVTIHSETKEFYDYNVDNGDVDVTSLGYFVGGTTPAQDTNIWETLSMSAATGSDVSTAAANRSSSAQSTSVMHPISPGAIRNARIQIDNINQRDRAVRIKNLRASLLKHASALRKGVH